MLIYKQRLLKIASTQFYIFSFHFVEEMLFLKKAIYVTDFGGDRFSRNSKRCYFANKLTSCMGMLLAVFTSHLVMNITICPAL